jgi:hypothetical protein
MQTISFALINDLDDRWMDASDGQVNLTTDRRDLLLFKIKTTLQQLTAHKDFLITDELIERLVAEGACHHPFDGQQTIAFAINFQPVVISESRVINWIEKKKKARSVPRPWTYGDTQQPEAHQRYFERPFTLKPSPRQIAAILAEDQHLNANPIDLTLTGEDAPITCCGTPSWDVKTMWMALAWPYVLDDLRVRGYDHCDEKTTAEQRPSCPAKQCQSNFARHMFNQLRSFEADNSEVYDQMEPSADAAIDGLAGLVIIGDCFIHKSAGLALAEAVASGEVPSVLLHEHAMIVAFVNQSDATTSAGKGVVKALCDYMQRMGVKKGLLISQAAFTTDAKKYVAQVSSTMSVTLAQYRHQYTFDWWNHSINQPNLPIYVTHESQTGVTPYHTSTYQQSKQVAATVLAGLEDNVSACTKVMSNGVLATRFGLKPGDLLHCQRYYPKTSKMIRIACVPKEKK